MNLSVTWSEQVSIGLLQEVGAVLLAGLLTLVAAIWRGWVRPPEPPNSLRVYLSSTLDDLADQRSTVRQALARLPVTCLGDSPAVAPASVPDRLGQVRDCGLYIGIFAWRYGDVPVGENTSIAELEYRQAVRHGRRRLILLLPQDRPWPPDQVDQGQDRQRIESLRSTLRADEHCQDLPASPAKLAALVKAEVAASLTGPAVVTRLREQVTDPLGLVLAVALGGFGALAQRLDHADAAAVWWTALATCLIAYAVRLALAISGWQLARPVRSHP